MNETVYEKIKYYYELENYTFDNITNNLGRDCVNELIKKRACVLVKKEREISFHFVGAVFYKDLIILVLPKYISRNISENQKALNMRKIMRILKVYEKQSTKNKEEEYLISNLNNTEVSDFILADFILNDYSRYGYFRKKQNIVVQGGEGEIDWDQTINDTTPFFVNSRPYYLETFNKMQVNDDRDVILKIHMWAVAFCYKNFGLILDYNLHQIDTSINNIKFIGNKDYLINVLKRELNQTYLDQKVNLLKSLITLIGKYANFARSTYMTLYGTRSYALVWQDICSFIFTNEIDKFNRELQRPLWINSIEKDINDKKDTFKPDIIKTLSYGADDFFIVLDAKYYLINFNGKELENNPDINDVAKQLLYQKAFEHLKGNVFRNIFLFPSNKTDNLFIPFGFVNLEFVGSSPINLVYVSIEKANDLYLSRSSLSKIQLDEFMEVAERHYLLYESLKKLKVKSE
ncbi:LlaJI family restriction endonuclease [Bacillus cereus]|uniref:LlaJI family restriction endonuclease n=1 Tax=Bacillus cereus TaxID=1396 RepID=UPI003636A139